MDLVIIAGGKGTRLGLKNIPKPMVSIAGKPLLEHQIILAKKYGIKKIYILSGYLSEVISNYFGDGKNFGIDIRHVVEKTTLGTAGAVKQLENILHDNFMIFYGDTFININLNDFILFEKKMVNSIGAIAVHPNDHPYDSDLLELNSNKIIKFHPKPHKHHQYYTNLVNAALYIFSPKIFNYIPKNIQSDFGKDIFPTIIKSENLYAYRTSEYIKDMGTPERLDEVLTDFNNGKIRKSNITYIQKAIFLDRDGVINQEVDNLSSASNFELIDGAAEAISKINRSNFLAIVATNQPMIAKGFMTEEDLLLIHKKMDTLLGERRAYLDDVYYCPHHPDKGFANEIKDLKINCECRKPKGGMLLSASQKYNIDLKNSWMLGDRYTDISAGESVGCKTVLIKTGHAGNDSKLFPNIKPKFSFNNLTEAVDYILKEDASSDNNKNTI